LILIEEMNLNSVIVIFLSILKIYQKKSSYLILSAVSALIEVEILLYDLAFANHIKDWNE